MASEERPITVIAAAAANLVIAAAKFTAAVITGSSAMLAEGIHSVVDTGNEVLLLIGVRRSRRRPDATHPMGYGRELYFWSLIVSILLFGVGGGFSIYEGIHRLRNPGEHGSAAWNYAVLAVAFVSEGISWMIAARAIRRRETGNGFWQKLHQSKDPSKFMVVGEDTAALLGVLAAFLGVFFSHRLNASWPDGVASIVIGGILCGVAVYLASETKHLLIGESADPAVVRQLRELTAKQAGVREVGPPATVYLGPDEVVLILNVQFSPELAADGVARTIDDIEREIQRARPEMKHIFIEAQRPPSGGEPSRGAARA